MRLFTSGCLALYAASQSIAFAQDVSPPASSSPENSSPTNAEASKSAVSTPMNTSMENEGRFGPWRFGPSVSLTVPRILTVGADVEFQKTFGMGITFGIPPELKIFDVKATMKSWEIAGRWYPWASSIYVGLGFGGLSIDANATTTVQATTSIGLVTTTARATGTLTTSFTTPHIGWQWILGPGFTLGTEIGVHIPLGADSKVSTSTSDAQSAAALKASGKDKEIREQEEDAEKVFKTLGKQILPHWRILRIGWMF